MDGQNLILSLSHDFFNFSLTQSPCPQTVFVEETFEFVLPINSLSQMDAKFLSLCGGALFFAILGVFHHSVYVNGQSILFFISDKRQVMPVAIIVRFFGHDNERRCSVVYQTPDSVVFGFSSDPELRFPTTDFVAPDQTSVCHFFCVFEPDRCRKTFLSDIDRI